MGTSRGRELGTTVPSAETILKRLAKCLVCHLVLVTRHCASCCSPVRFSLSSVHKELVRYVSKVLNISIHLGNQTSSFLFFRTSMTSLASGLPFFDLTLSSLFECFPFFLFALTFCPSSLPKPFHSLNCPR